MNKLNDDYTHFKTRFFDSQIQQFDLSVIRSKMAWFFIWDAALSTQFPIDTRMAIGVWLTEIQRIQVFAVQARNKFKDPSEQGAWFAVHVLYYLMYQHPSEDPTFHKSEMKCPYTSYARNFIVSLVMTKQCQCECYTTYIQACAEEFEFDTIHPCSVSGHVFTVIRNRMTSDILITLDAGYEDNTTIHLETNHTNPHKFLDDLQLERFTLLKLEKDECTRSNSPFVDFPLASVNMLLQFVINKKSMFAKALRIIMIGHLYNVSQITKWMLMAARVLQENLLGWLTTTPSEWNDTTRFDMIKRNMREENDTTIYHFALEWSEDLLGSTFFYIWQQLLPLLQPNNYVLNNLLLLQLTQYDFRWGKTSKKGKFNAHWSDSIALNIDDGDEDVDWLHVTSTQDIDLANVILSDVLMRHGRGSKPTRDIVIFYDVSQFLFDGNDHKPDNVYPMQHISAIVLLWKETNRTKRTISSQPIAFFRSNPKRVKSKDHCEKQNCLHTDFTAYSLGALECVQFCVHHLQESLRKLIQWFQEPHVVFHFEGFESVNAHLKSFQWKWKTRQAKHPWEQLILDPRASNEIHAINDINDVPWDIEAKEFIFEMIYHVENVLPDRPLGMIQFKENNVQVRGILITLNNLEYGLTLDFYPTLMNFNELNL